MKKTILSLVVLILQLPIWVGCRNSNSEIIALMNERDSLRRESERANATLEDYGFVMETIKSTLDSISTRDEMIFVGHGELPVTRDEVLENLNRFEETLQMQQRRINYLERELARSNDSTSSALRIIAHLNEQISIKNNKIAQLREQLANANVDIARLQQQVESQKITIQTQTATITELTTRTNRQSEALARQDAILNNGYVLIGSKEDLKRKGVIRRNRLVPEAALDRSKFFQVDIRQWREINFTARRPQVLTDMPTSSYQITTSGDRNFTLRILNPTDFWKISNYLIIQTD